MELLDCFKYLVDQIHTVVIATNDAQGLPQTRAIDLLGYDEAGLYLSTAAGKAFCSELEAQGFLALTGMAGASTMERVAVSVRGAVRAEGPEKLDALFDANPYMHDLYPSAESRAMVRIFCIHRGTLDWYDLRTTPLTRLSFTFGGLAVDAEARRSSLRDALLNMLLIETCGGDAEQAASLMPAEEPARAALLDRLLAERCDAPMSADLYEAWRMYEDAR